MSKHETRTCGQYKSTLSCKAVMETTTGPLPRRIQAFYLVPTKHIVTSKKSGDVIILPEEGIKERDYIEASNRAYAALAPNERHELDIWDITLNDGLEEY